MNIPDATFQKILKHLQWVVSALPKPGSGGEVFIQNLRTGRAIATLTHYDPEVEDANDLFNELAAIAILEKDKL